MTDVVHDKLDHDKLDHEKLVPVSDVASSDFELRIRSPGMKGICEYIQ